MTDLTAPMFNDETAAREYFEAQRWANGVYVRIAATPIPPAFTSLQASRTAPACISATLAASTSP